MIYNTRTVNISIDRAMAFRKRNVGLSGSSLQSQNPGSGTQSAPIPGVRPSPLDGRPTTSNGTSSLDDLLGHSGFALGNSLLIEENGTTEFGATLLRYFAAEGVVQGHRVHIVGVGEPWGRELPAVVKTATGGEHTKPEAQTAAEKDRMKIAWRYERLGDFGAGPSGARGGTPVVLRSTIAVHNATYFFRSQVQPFLLANSRSIASGQQDTRLSRLQRNIDSAYRILSHL